LAIAANAAIFSLVHRVVLNPLPYPESDRLIDLDHGAALINVPAGLGMKVGLYHYYKDRSRTLDGVAIFNTGNATLTGDGEPERIVATRTTTTLASVLGVSPALGRWFSEDEGFPGAPPVGVISHGLWTRRYGEDPEVVGRRVVLDDVPTTIIGVMPAGYAFPDPRVDVWLAEAIARTAGLGIWTHDGVARMRDGVTVADVNAEINGLIRDLPTVFPDDPLLDSTGPDFGVMSTVRTLKDATIGDVGRTLWILLAAVGVVMLVACANVANLFLVRAEARQREIAVRRAIGARAGVIARLFMAESTLLSVAGGLAGLALAWGAVRTLVATAPVNLPRLGEVRLDGVVIAFAFILSILAALVFGSVPLWRRAQPTTVLDQSGRRNTSSRGTHRARHLLMGGQVALALVLLASSGLMVRSFLKLRGVDPGFNAESTLTFTIGLPISKYPGKDAAVAAHLAILHQLSELPGVSGVSASTCLPLSGGCFGNGVFVDGREDQDIDLGTSFRAIAGGYFETMGIRLLRGRGIERGDVERSEPIAVVDKTFADRFFPNEDPIGRRVTWSHPPQPGKVLTFTWLTIVGVVAPTPVRTLGETARVPQLHMPMSLTGEFGAPSWEYVGPEVGTMNYVIRSTSLPSGLMSSVRTAIDTVDPRLALARVSTLEERLENASAPMAFTMVLLAIAAAVALMMGLIGIYGVVSYIVTQRTNEIGVRLALGAEPGGVTAMIVRQGGLVALAGIAIGLGVALASGRLIESLLYDVSPHDPAVLVATTLLLFGVVILACWIPASRAARVNPADALRLD
jgi:predicted permease